jgi:hypothetical protein
MFGYNLTELNRHSATKEKWVRCQIIVRGVCDEQIGTGTDLYLRFAYVGVSLS